MKTFAKVALSALVLAGAATAVASSPADARVVVGFGVGPGYYGYGPAYYPRYSCDPYSRWYNPYRCGGYYDGYYGGPAYYGPAYYGPSIGFSFGGGGWGGHRGGWGGGFHGGGHHR